MTKICVSIINYKTAELTLDCVRSVRADLLGINAQIIVVDNASNDGSVDTIASWISEKASGGDVRLVCSDTNTGFSGGHNQGIAAAKADYYLVLNSDAVLRPGFFKAILETAAAHPEAGLIAPRLEGEAGDVQDSCFRFPSPRSELIRGACSGPVTRALARYTVGLGPDPDVTDIDWASFACILLNGRMVTDIGPMDEGYFLYFEDTEYALRARRSGWSLVPAPNAVAVHFRGGSGDVKSRTAARHRLPAYFYRSRARFFRQAYGPTGPLRANLMWSLGRGVATLRWLTGRRPNPAIKAEARDIWIGMTAPLTPHTKT